MKFLLAFATSSPYVCVSKAMSHRGTHQDGFFDLRCTPVNSEGLLYEVTQRKGAVPRATTHVQGLLPTSIAVLSVLCRRVELLGLNRHKVVRL